MEIIDDDVNSTLARNENVDRRVENSVENVNQSVNFNKPDIIGDLFMSIKILF